MIVEQILGSLQDFETENLRVDKVLLDHFDMTKPHQRLKSEEGTTVAVSLPRGEHLFCGAVLYKDEEKIIAVDLLPEDVLEIRPEGNLQWAKTAFNIGNMHHPAYLQEDCILIPYDGILENLLKGIGVSYSRCRKKLEGERASHVVGGHSHDHHHSHDHSRHGGHSCHGQE